MKNYEKKIEKLRASLETIKVEIDEVLVRAERGINISKEVLKEIRKEVITEGFKNNEDEIYFFKKIKPRIYSKLIYNVKLFCIESRRPNGSSKNQIKFLNKEIYKLQEYFNQDLDFYLYVRRDSNVFDEQYFLRGKENLRFFPDTFHFYTDEDFSTSHDSSVATIMAYDLLIVYLKQEIDKLESSNSGSHTLLTQKQSNIVWTSQKVNLIELIYALHSTDVINNGKVDIKDIARVTERIFKIDLGDYYKAFLEIRMRKKGRTKFLDLLKENLEKRMDEIDD